MGPPASGGEETETESADFRGAAVGARGGWAILKSDASATRRGERGGRAATRGGPA